MAPFSDDVRVWVEPGGKCPFEVWFSRLDGRSAAKVTVALRRLATGNDGHVRALGDGVSELKIDWGPGLRVYFGRVGTTIVVLLGGGDKHRQQSDIDAAKARWADFDPRRMRPPGTDDEPWP